MSIDYQSKRKDVCTAAQRRGGGGVKIFRWGVSPSKSLNTATTSPTYTFGHSNRQAIIPPAYPLPPTNTTYTAQHSTRTRTQAIRALSVADAPHFDITWQPGYLVIGTGPPY